MIDILKKIFKDKKNISRRNLLKILGISASVPFLYLFYKTIDNQEIQNKTREKVIIPNNTPEGTTISDSVIINKEGNNISVYSSRCTHLGCTINRLEGGELLCPCHGSRFSINGGVLKGPASKPLEKLELLRNESTGELFVNV